MGLFRRRRGRHALGAAVAAPAPSAVAAAPEPWLTASLPYAAVQPTPSPVDDGTVVGGIAALIASGQAWGDPSLRSTPVVEAAARPVAVPLVPAPVASALLAAAPVAPAPAAFAPVALDSVALDSMALDCVALDSLALQTLAPAPVAPASVAPAPMALTSVQLLEPQPAVQAVPSPLTPWSPPQPTPADLLVDPAVPPSYSLPVQLAPRPGSVDALPAALPPVSPSPLEPVTAADEALTAASTLPPLASTAVPLVSAFADSGPVLLPSVPVTVLPVPVITVQPAAEAPPVHPSSTVLTVPPPAPFPMSAPRGLAAVLTPGQAPAEIPPSPRPAGPARPDTSSAFAALVAAEVDAPRVPSALEPAAADLLAAEPPAAPRVQLGFRDGSTASLDPDSDQAAALEQLAILLNLRDD